MNPKSAIQKGKDLENYVADRIVALGIDQKARRDGGSGNGNREKGDIVTSMTIFGLNAGIECKNHSSLAIPDWWRQTKKLELVGREPILAFKMRGEVLDESKVVIYLETFLKLVKAANNASGDVVEREFKSPESERELKWAIEGLKHATNKVLKLL